MLEVGGMEVEWDGDDDEDYWLSQTLQVQESKDTSMKGVTSTPRPQDSQERGMESLPASTVSKEDFGRRLAWKTGGGR